MTKLNASEWEDSPEMMIFFDGENDDVHPLVRPDHSTAAPSEGLYLMAMAKSFRPIVFGCLGGLTVRRGNRQSGRMNGQEVSEEHGYFGVFEVTGTT